jgi:HK97 family phage prohead protease
MSQEYIDEKSFDFTKERHLNVSAQKTSFDANTREFEAIISTNQIDRYQEIIEPRGIFLPEGETSVSLLYGHDSKLLIGKSIYPPQTSDVDVRMKFKLTSTPFANDCAIMLEDGTLNKFSIGFISKEREIDKELKILKHKKSELCEVSAVPVPANIGAKLLEYKSMFTSPEMKEFVAEYEKESVKKDMEQMANEMKDMIKNEMKDMKNMITKLNEKVSKIENTKVEPELKIEKEIKNDDYVSTKEAKKLLNEFFYGKVS